MIKVGDKVLVHTVTFYWSGEIVQADKQTITLKEAAWIADTGRYSEAFRTGQFVEVEPVPGLVHLERANIVAIVEWAHELPRVPK